MAEGGIEMDILKDYNHDEDNEVESSFQNDIEFHKYINEYFEQLENLSPEDQITHKSKIIKQMVKRFYKVNNELDLNKNRKDFFFGGDDKGRINLYVRYGYGKKVRLTHYEEGVIKFYQFSTLKGNYGVNFIRNVLGVDYYNISNKYMYI